MRGSILRGLLFGPGHLNSPMVLGAAAAAAHRPVSLSAIGVVVVVRPDARQPQHGVTVFHQLGLVWYKNTQTCSFSPHLKLFFYLNRCLPLLHHCSCLSVCLFVPVCLCFLWRCLRWGLQYSCTWGKDTPTDNTKSPNLLIQM